MLTWMPRGLRRAIVGAAALLLSGLSVSSAQAATALMFFSAFPNPATYRVGSTVNALVIGFGNGAPTGSVVFEAGRGGSDVGLSAAGAGNPIAAGLAHTCAITPSSGVKCWGAGGWGQLGDGLGQNSTTPVDVTGVTGAIAVSAASLHTCALLASGGVTCWGKNFGLAPVAIPSITDARAISANGEHTCALLATGGVKCWGLNTSGQLGDGTTQSSSTPVDVVGLGSNAIAVAAGYAHTCAIIDSGAVKCWGSNAHGKLGGGSSVGAFTTTPIDVVGLTEHFTYIAAGENHTCAAQFEFSFTRPALKCWGDNSLGQLGTGDNVEHSTPVDVGFDPNLFSLLPVGLYAGGSHNCAVDRTGELRCWGGNANGQIGNGGTSNINKLPFRLVLDPLASVPALGGHHTCAALKTGALKCWGDNSKGQYGNGLVQSQKTPLDISNVTIAVFGRATTRFGAIAGTNTLNAKYERGNYDPITSSITYVVLPESTTLTLTASPNPSTLGKPVTFTAKVTPLGIRGTMELWEGTQLLATGPFESQASFTIGNLPVGTHTITATATYDDPSNHISAAPGVLQQTVLRAPTRVALSAAPTSPTRPVVLVASVTEIGTNNGAIAGSVTFKHNDTSLGTASVSSGVAKLNVGTWPIGTQTFTATYNGSATFQPSNGSGVATVDPTIGAAPDFIGATGGLKGTFRMPAAARLATGRFVVTTFLSGAPVLTSGTYFQQYTALGQPVGAFTRVKPMLAVDDVFPKVAAVGTGFVVVYNWREHIDSPQQIRAQRYNALGARVGVDFKINTTNPGHITEHQVAKLADGGFVVVWGAGPNKSQSGEIYARRYNVNGVPLTGEFIVNTTLNNTQDMPAVAALADGGFFVVWSSTVAGGSVDLFGQRYAANGIKAGGEVRLTTSPGISENAPAIAALHNGGFVAAWTRSFGADATVRGRRYTAAGIPNGAEFVIGGQNYGHWEPITITVLDDDRFLVAYAKQGASSAITNIYAKLLGPTAAADAATGEFRVDSVIGGLRPSAVALSNRNVFIAWESNRIRRLDLPAVP